MFHEFGHALHGFFADQTYPTLSGTSVARDYVEFTSQFNEHWALDSKVFAHYARHYQTGAPMPGDLVDKIKKAAKFNGGYALTEVVSAAALDMEWHTLPPGSAAQDVDRRGRALEKNCSGLPWPPRYRSSYSSHLGQRLPPATTPTSDRDARRRCVCGCQEHGGLTREGAPAIPGPVPRQHRGLHEDVPRFPRPGIDHRAHAGAPRTEITYGVNLLLHRLRGAVAERRAGTARGRAPFR
jgi:peptidyl-dipeptidase Dcp